MICENKKPLIASWQRALAVVGAVLIAFSGVAACTYELDRISTAASAAANATEPSAE